jgi:hypothetical protein
MSELKITYIKSISPKQVVVLNQVREMIMQISQETRSIASIETKFTTQANEALINYLNDLILNCYIQKIDLTKEKLTFCISILISQTKAITSKSGMLGYHIFTLLTDQKNKIWNILLDISSPVIIFE